MKNHAMIFRSVIVMLGVMLCIPLTGLGEIRDLSVQELKAMLDSNQTFFLLNPLSDIEFNEGHIPGSVNIPLHRIIQSEKMPKDMDTPIITYCLSEK